MHPRRIPALVGLASTCLVLAAPGLHGAAAAGEPTCDGQVATIVGTEEPDVLVGTDGRDVMVGLGGDDDIRGGGRGDLVCAGAGDDRVRGEAGNDRLFGEGGDDRIRPGRHSDVVSWSAGGGHDVVGGDHRSRGDAIEVLGSTSDDTFVVQDASLGGRPADRLFLRGDGSLRYREIERVEVWLGSGRDGFVVDGREADVSYHVVHAGEPDGAGGSTADGVVDRLVWRGTDAPEKVGFSAEAGPGGLVGTRVGYSFRTSEVSDRIVVDGGGGRDHLSYGPFLGPNRLTFTSVAGGGFVVDSEQPETGEQLRQPFSGFEALDVTLKWGRDHIDLSALRPEIPVIVLGGVAADTFIGSDGDDRFNGGAGGDTAYGGRGRDVLLGRGADDELYGGRGRDRLNGGTDGWREAEADGCTGGPARDRFVGCEHTTE